MSVKILIIKLSSLGDVIHTFEPLRALKRHFTKLDIDLKLDFLVKEKFASILDDPELNFIDKVQILPNKGFWQLIPALKSINYDYIIDMQGLIKTGLLAYFIKNSSKSKIIGFKRPREQLAALFYQHKLDLDIKSNHEHIIDMNFKLLEFFCAQVSVDLAVSDLKNINLKQALLCSSHLEGSKSVPNTSSANIYNANTEVKTEHQANLILKPSSAEQKSIIQLNNFNNEIQASALQENDIKKVAILPCTTWQSKHWLIENWVEVINRLIKTQSENISIELIGAPVDLAYLSKIYQQVNQPECLKITSDQKLNQLRSYFKQFQLVLGVDTGPLHLAADVLDPFKAQIIGLYGPTAATRTGPYGFQALNSSDLTSNVPSHKKTYLEDEHSMSLITPQMLFKLIKVLSIK